MIFDKMERLAQYKGMNANLDKLIDFVLNNSFDALQPGRNEIDGENCWLNNNVAPLQAQTDLYERHMDYIDLQIPIDDGEIITVKPVEDLDWPLFDTETAFSHGSAGTPLDLVSGTFAIFFPGDAHNCGISKAGVQQVRKLVGKARIL